jgi:hypothetical protein
MRDRQGTDIYIIEATIHFSINIYRVGQSTTIERKRETNISIESMYESYQDKKDKRSMMANGNERLN